MGVDDEIKGVELESGDVILGQKFIVTTGTFMQAKIMVGDDIKLEGPDKQKPSLGLSPQLRELGFDTQRLKTGTPPRIKRGSIDFSKTEEHPGDLEERCFSYDNIYYFDVNKQWPCYLTYTAPSTHSVILNNLELSSMYSGVVEGVGPRYCPSIEDKLVRFKDKARHQIFLEPESVTLDEIYVQGFPTSLPHHVQDEMVRTIPGLENAEIVKYAYAIEYDAIDSRDLYASLASKKYSNLYFAGQVNGTSGYEEAACQGLMAGINASLDLEGKAPLVLKRHEAYIGVLIDDLVTKGVNDPYRLLTSRAEYRLLLRHDNADIRLREYGYQVGLVDENRYKGYKKKLNEIDLLKNELKEYEVTPNKKVGQFLEEIGSTAVRNRTSLYDLIRRPELNIIKLNHFVDLDKYSKASIEQAEIDIKYEGYIKKAMKQAEKMLKMEHYKIPSSINYDEVHNLAHV